MATSDLRKVIRRGDVWVCDFTAENGENSTCRIIKKRFCLVISSDEWNSLDRTYPLVLPMSTTAGNNDTETITCSLGEFKPTSYIRTSAIQSVSLCHLLQHKGTLSIERMDEVDAHLSAVFGLDIKKYIDKIAALEAELLRAKELNESLLRNLNKDISTEASELVLENDRLKEEIARLNNTLKYRDKQLSMFSIPVRNEQQPAEIKIITKSIDGSETDDPKANRKIRKYNRGKVNVRVVLNDWSARKCLYFVKFAEANSIANTMEKYGIISDGTYRNVLNACKTKAYSK